MDRRFYEEYLSLRALGSSAAQAFQWACDMRACDYSPFED